MNNDDYIELLMENEALRKENTDLKCDYQKECNKRLKEKETFYARNRVNRRIAVAAGTFISAVSIAATSALNYFIGNMNNINSGRIELANRVQSECLYGMGMNQ